MSSSSESKYVSGATGKRGAGVCFINEPKSFDGDTFTVNGVIVWLNRMARLKTNAKHSDEEILFVLGDHVTGKAETWWNVISSTASSWEQSEGLFKKHYLADQEDKWWHELQNVKQGAEYPTVDDVSSKLQELFVLVDNKSERYEIRTFLNAIKPSLAFEVEKGGSPSTFSKAVEMAKQIEQSSSKYSLNSSGLLQELNASGDAEASKDYGRRSSGVSQASAVSSMFSLVYRLEKRSINLVKLSNGVENTQIQSVQPSRRQLVCFRCNQPGHKKYGCPQYERNVATGSNALPITSNGEYNGSGSAYQGQGQGKAQGISLK